MTGADASPVRATLPAGCRLKTQRQFRLVYGRGRRAAGQWMTVVGFLGTRPQPARLGLSVSKANGQAVRRNKIKRLLREAFRLERHRLPDGLDLVLIPKPRDDRYPLAELRLELVALVDRLRAAPARPRRRGPRTQGSGGAS